MILTNILLGIIVILILSLAVISRPYFLSVRKEIPRLDRNSPYYLGSYNYPINETYYEVYRFITDVEVEMRIKLSVEAKQMLILPLIEVFSIKQFPTDYNGEFSKNSSYYDYKPWKDSIFSLMKQIRDKPARMDFTRVEDGIALRTSLSVIKAFEEKFCEIPPFCGERKY